MWDNWWVFVVVGGILVAIFVEIGTVFLPAWQKHRSEVLFVRGRVLFQHRREWLEARFLTLAERSGKPRGLRWANCDFDDDVAFARDRRTGRPRARQDDDHREPREHDEAFRSRLEAPEARISRGLR